MFTRCGGTRQVLHYGCSICAVNTELCKTRISCLRVSSHTYPLIISNVLYSYRSWKLSLHRRRRPVAGCRWKLLLRPKYVPRCCSTRSSLTLADNDTLSIDLTKSWTNSSITFNTINKTAQGVPQWNSENLWPDPSGESFYQWDGEWSYLRLNYGTPQSILYQCTPDGKGGESRTPPRSSSSSVGLFPNLQ